VVKVQFPKLLVLLETLNLFNFIEGEDEDQEVRQVLHVLYFLNLIVKQVQVDNPLNLVLATNAFDEVLTDVV